MSERERVVSAEVEDAAPEVAERLRAQFRAIEALESVRGPMEHATLPFPVPPPPSWRDRA